MTLSRRTFRRITTTTLAAAALLVASSGCTELGDEFRAAAGPKLESGVNDLLTGIVSGAFEVFEPGKSSDSSD
ncbi:MAG: hypothetical protein ACYSUI_08790 [Planctomycetota bacterium]|jgi:hypothetical protein